MQFLFFMSSKVYVQRTAKFNQIKQVALPCNTLRPVLLPLTCLALIIRLFDSFQGSRMFTHSSALFIYIKSTSAKHDGALSLCLSGFGVRTTLYQLCFWWKTFPSSLRLQACAVSRIETS